MPRKRMRMPKREGATRKQGRSEQLRVRHLQGNVQTNPKAKRSSSQKGFADETGFLADNMLREK